MKGPGVAVSTGARLHFGLRNLARAGDRLFGGIGLAIAEPGISLTVRPADRITADHRRAQQIAIRVVDYLKVDGASIEVDRSLPAHVGYGSGTQLTLAVALGIAHAHGINPSIRELASHLDRGGRSGVGVACVETGGFVVDAGHPIDAVDTHVASERVAPIARQTRFPRDWRIVLLQPAVSAGRSGTHEDRSIQRAIEQADPTIADRIEEQLETAVLPGINSKDIDTFGAGITRIDTLTGQWFASEQGEIHRPPCDSVIEGLADAPSIAGWGQSSWGPLCYGFTTRDDVPDAIADCQAILDRTGIPGSITVTEARNRGIAIRPVDGATPT